MSKTPRPASTVSGELQPMPKGRGPIPVPAYDFKPLPVPPKGANDRPASTPRPSRR